MESMFPLQCYGTGYLPVRSPARGAKLNGRNSWSRKWQCSGLKITKRCTKLVGECICSECNNSDDDLTLTTEKAVFEAFSEWIGGLLYLC